MVSKKRITDHVRLSSLLKPTDTGRERVRKPERKRESEGEARERKRRRESERKNWEEREVKVKNLLPPLSFLLSHEKKKNRERERERERESKVASLLASNKHDCHSRINQS
jgi:hypothetical protein